MTVTHVGYYTLELTRLLHTGCYAPGYHGVNIACYGVALAVHVTLTLGAQTELN